MSYLSGNTTKEIIENGPMAGALFENFVISEIYKSFSNRGIKPPLYHFRDSQGVEVDLVLEHENKYLLLELKMTMTPKKDHASGLEKVNKLFPTARSIVLCNVMNKTLLSIDTVAIPWLDIFEILGEFTQS